MKSKISNSVAIEYSVDMELSLIEYEKIAKTAVKIKDEFLDLAKEIELMKKEDKSQSFNILNDLAIDTNLEEQEVIKTENKNIILKNVREVNKVKKIIFTRRTVS